jgi:hypothetical protein
MVAPASVANLGPPLRGAPAGGRRSSHVGRTLRLSRKYCPEAIQYCAKVMRDESEDTQRRLKAAEIILFHGLPKGEQAKYLADESPASITINVVHHERPEAPQISQKPDLELPSIVINTVDQP